MAEIKQFVRDIKCITRRKFIALCIQPIELDVDASLLYGELCDRYHQGEVKTDDGTS